MHSDTEREITQIIDSYGAPIVITDEIKRFLFEAGNIEAISEIILENTVNDDWNCI